MESALVNVNKNTIGTGNKKFPFASFYFTLNQLKYLYLLIIKIKSFDCFIYNEMININIVY